MERLDLLLLVIYLLLFFYLYLHSVVVVYSLGLFLWVYKSNITAVTSMLSSNRYLQSIQWINLIIVCSILHRLNSFILKWSFFHWNISHTLYLNILLSLWIIEMIIRSFSSSHFGPYRLPPSYISDIRLITIHLSHIGLSIVLPLKIDISFIKGVVACEGWVVKPRLFGIKVPHGEFFIELVLFVVSIC